MVGFAEWLLLVERTLVDPEVLDSYERAFQQGLEALIRRTRDPDLRRAFEGMRSCPVRGRDGRCNRFTDYILGALVRNGCHYEYDLEDCLQRIVFRMLSRTGETRKQRRTIFDFDEDRPYDLRTGNPLEAIFKVYLNNEIRSIRGGKIPALRTRQRTANPPAQVDVDPLAGHWLPSASRRPLYWKAILTARAAKSAFLVNLWRLAMRRFVVVGAFFAAIAAFTIVGADAEPRTPAPVASLTAEVHRLLSESTFSYPDPWKPRRERPRQFFVIPGEKLDYAERLTAMGLAGLVNRAGPRLFVRGHFRFNADADRFWLSRLERDYGMPHKEIGLDQALKEFRGAFRGAVLCDDQLPATQAVALTLAGVLRLLPAMPSMQARLEAAGIPVTLDLRGAWKDNLAAQQWAFDLVGPRLNDQLIGFLDVRDKALWGIADYLVMHGGFIADLSSDRVKYPEEYALRDRAMARLKPGSIVWGWECHDNETLHVAHASRRGLRVLCSTNCPNLSFLALVKPETEQYRQRSPAPCHRPVEKELYLTFVLSDGDSIPIREKCPISTGS